MASQVTYIDVQYNTVAREERGTSLKRADEASGKIRFCIIHGGIPREIGVFTLAEMRLMLGSEHLHYKFIVEYLLNPDKQYDDEHAAGWDSTTHTKQYLGASGLNYSKFKEWSLKFRGAANVTQFL